MPKPQNSETAAHAEMARAHLELRALLYIAALLARGVAICDAAGVTYDTFSRDDTRLIYGVFQHCADDGVSNPVWIGEYLQRGLRACDCWDFVDQRPELGPMRWCDAKLARLMTYARQVELERDLEPQMQRLARELVCGAIAEGEAT